MESLAALVRRTGPLEARDAVRLVLRAARALAPAHERGHVHGELDWDAFLFEGAGVTLLGPRETEAAVAFRAPERIQRGAKQPGDDAWGLAVVLYAALTGAVPFQADTETETALLVRTMRPSPLAVFDAGDDDLDGVLEGALAKDAALRPRGVAGLVRELEAWRARAGHQEEIEPLLPSAGLERWLELAASQEPASARGPLDVASLPPPPADPSAPRRAPLEKSVFSMLSDEDTTLPRDDVPADPPTGDERETLPHAPTPSVRPPPVIKAPRLPSGRPPPVMRGASTSGDIPVSSARPSVTPAPPSAREALLADGAPAPAPTWKPEPSRRRAPFVVAGALVLGVAGYFGLRGGDPPAPPALVSSADPVASVDAAASAPTAEPSASSVPAPSASVSAVPVAPADPAACLAGLFAPDSFAERKASLAWVCTEGEPTKGAKRTRETLVRAGSGRVTDGMKEWAVMGWYELAAYAALRGRCCAAGAELSLPRTPPSCPSMEEALERIARAAQPGAPDADADASQKGYDEALRCLLRTRKTKPFGKYPKLGGGEDTSFRKTLDRARKP